MHEAARRGRQADNMNAFRRQFGSVVEVEWGLVRGHPKVRLSAVGILFLPALYALIYL